MKFVLKTKNPETQEIVDEKEFISIRQISQHLNVTYCSCHKNAMYSLLNTKPGKKIGQALFDRKYTIICVE